MAQITYDNKVKLNDDPNIPDINKITDGNMNEIKSVVNGNDNDFQNSLPVILYDNSAGTNGNVSLSDDSRNYEYLEVYGFETTTNSSIYTKYSVSSGKDLNLNTNVSSENGNLMRYISTNYSVSGASIIPSANSGIVNIFDKTINAQQQENAILITKVVGWR